MVSIWPVVLYLYNSSTLPCMVINYSISIKYIQDLMFFIFTDLWLAHMHSCLQSAFSGNCNRIVVGLIDVAFLVKGKDGMYLWCIQLQVVWWLCWWSWWCGKGDDGSWWCDGVAVRGDGAAVRGWWWFDVGGICLDMIVLVIGNILLRSILTWGLLSYQFRLWSKNKI